MDANSFREGDARYLYYQLILNGHRFSRLILKRVTEFVYSDAAAQVRSEALVVSPLMCLKLKVLSVRGISDQIKALIMPQPGSMNHFRFSVNSGCIVIYVPN